MTKTITRTLDENRRQAKQLMKRILMSFRARLDEELRPRGVTTAQLQILHAIRSSPGSSGAQLARVCQMTPQSMQVLIQKTEKDGWMERRKDRENDRVLVASLTKAGERLMRDAEAVVGRIEKQLWVGVSAVEVAVLVRVLERCLGNIEDE
jgi:MarR family transcriptional regulator, organic hydroperoxide resistance regulator